MPGMRFFTAPSITVQPTGTSAVCSLPLCSMYLILGIQCGSVSLSQGFSGNRQIRKPFRRNGCVRRDEPAPDNVFGGGIDGLDRRDHAPAQMEDREFPPLRIAAH